MLKPIITTLLFAGLLRAAALATGPFAPAAGQTGSTAIQMDSAVFVSWATHIAVQRGFVNIADTTVQYDGSNRASFGEPAYALGKATGNSNLVVSLGDGGVATLQFDRPIINGEGPDFAIFENGFGDFFLELAFVEVSSNGEKFVRFPALSYTPVNTQIGGFGTLDPTYIHNFAGKYRAGYGTPFDLEDLVDSTGIDVNHIRFIRIIDVVGCTSCGHERIDSEGNIINDPWPTPFHTGGFDLEAVGIIHGGEPFEPSSVDNLISPKSHVFPNPFTHGLHIKTLPGSTIQIFDTMGRLLLQETYYDEKLYFSDIAAGYYMLRLVHNDHTETFKLLKR